MSVKLHCPECNASIRVPDELVGKQIRCPKCRTKFAADADADEPDSDIPVAELVEERPAIERVDPPKKSAGPPPVGPSKPSKDAGAKVRERSASRPQKSLAAKGVIVGAGAAAACGIIVLLVILLLRRGATSPDGSSVAQTGSAAEANPPGATAAASPARPEPAAAVTDSAPAMAASGKTFTPPDPDESARQLGLALKQYLRSHRSFPVSRRMINGKSEHGFDSEGRPLLSWRVHLLPYLGQKALYDEFNKNEAWDSPHNKALLASMPGVFRTGPRDDAKTQWHMLFGKDALTDLNRGAGIQQVRDGTANTIAFVLAGADRADFWTRPYDLPFELDKPLDALGKIDSGKIHCVMANCQPLSISAGISPETFAALVTPNGGEVVDVATLRRQEEQRSGKRVEPSGPQVTQDQTASLRRLYFCLRNFRSTYRQFPVIDRPEYLGQSGRPNVSWRVHLLPFLDQKALYSQFKLDEPWDSDNNRPLVAQMPDIFRAPDDPADTRTTRLLMVHVEGETTGDASPPVTRDAASRRRAGARISSQDRIRPKMLIAQVGPDRAVPWTKPDELEVTAEAPMAGLGTLPSSGFFVLMSNGNIYRLKPTLPPDVFRDLASGVQASALEARLGEYLIKAPDGGDSANVVTTRTEPTSSPSANRDGVRPTTKSNDANAKAAPSSNPTRDPVARNAVPQPPARDPTEAKSVSSSPKPAVSQTASSPSPNPVLVQNTGSRPARHRAPRTKSPPPAPVGNAPPARTPPLDMPEDYSDYAINPETGDILALSAENGQAVLFRGKDLDARKIEPAVKVRVGSTPCAAFFKRYRDLRLFAVVCSQDSHMYVINAADGTLLKKIDLTQSGVSNVTGSINPDDPFVYYNFGSGHGSIAGVVNLRSMENQGQAFNSSMDCAFSASGEIAYRRGPWSPSGFESLIRTNSLKDDKPVFVRLFYQHTSTPEYIPDPFDRYVAAGTSIYSRSLEKNEADLNFVPQCFFRSRPVIIGVTSTRIHALAPPSNMDLHAASYNTFSAIGTPVRLALAGASDNGELPRGVASQADFKHVTKRTSVFADDSRKQVIYASRRQIFFVGLDEFKLPDEPFLQATLEGSHALAIGQTSSLSVKLLDPRATVTFDDLPDGMKANGSQLEWQPRGDQLGPAKVTATIKAGDIQGTTTFELHVVYPSIALPYALAGMSVNPAGTQALIWDGRPTDRTRTASPEQNRAEGCALARFDLESGNVLAQRRLSEAIRRAVLTDEYAVLLTESLSPRCELFRAGDLKREKTLVTESPVLGFDFIGKTLAIRTETGIEIYETGSFKRIRVFETGDKNNPVPAPNIPGALQNGLTSDGLLVNGILYDADLKPLLVVTPGPIPWLAGAEARWQTRFASKESPAPFRGSGVPYNGASQIGSAKLPDSNAQITLTMRSSFRQLPGSPQTNRNRVELTVAASGDVEAKQILFSDERPAGTVDRSPGLFVAPGTAFVAFDRTLYRWRVKGDRAVVPASQPLRLAARQSAFRVEAKGKTVLKHTAKGGKTPLKFSIETPLDGIQIDEKTGDVTIDGSSLTSQAMRTVEQTFTRNNYGPSLLDVLESRVVSVDRRAAEILGHNPTGFPAAIPIRVEVSDADLNRDTLQYYVLAEVSTPDLKKRLRQLDEGRPEQTQSQTASPKKTGTKGPERTKANDDSDLRRRVEALEERLDLVTRQLNQLLKKSEGK
ncbi:MAG TPA: DUF1559 domain-containing protein [Planctomycetaceae bacterium]|jgi:predicted Zn finger-like uncharacterized protein|nr:DUF1559 domain-containing protein [Planctomycetaceae bacterium]